MNGNAKIPPLTATTPNVSKGNVQATKAPQQPQQPAIKTEPGQASQSTSTAAASSSTTQNGPPALQQTTLDPNKLIPIQITLPPQPNETENRVLTIKVPARAIQENQLQQVITGEIITSIMPLQPSVASAVLQQHVTSVLNNMYAKSE
jgi:transcription initiation factor TFIIA large subunit